MSRSDISSCNDLDWPVTNPWPLLIVGLGLTALALAVSRFTGPAWWWLRVLLILMGLIIAGSAVSLRLWAASSDLGDRFRSAGLVALAALAALLGCLALDPAWDTARLALGALTAVALAGAAVLLLPRVGRRIVVSLLLLYHFGGILMAVSSVPPPNGQAPWLTTAIWTYAYRPYLHFMYLNNAYHFYSPEPGPPMLLWFYVQYDDGSSRWVKLPNREDFRTRLEFQRRLALTESTNTTTGPGMDFEQRWQRRLVGDTAALPALVASTVGLMGSPLGSGPFLAGSAVIPGRRTDYMGNIRPELHAFGPDGIVPHDVVAQVLATGNLNALVIPPHPPQLMPHFNQYREPTPYSRLMIASYARHVAGNYRSESNPGAKVEGVKVYRVVHRILMPSELAAGAPPYHDTTFQPYYQGEFDKDGNLLDPNDPFLYWAIPIMPVAIEEPPPPFRVVGVPPAQPPKMVVRNFCEEHAKNVKTRKPREARPVE